MRTAEAGNWFLCGCKNVLHSRYIDSTSARARHCDVRLAVQSQAGSMSRGLAQPFKADNPQPPANCVSERVFTGNANVKPQAFMDTMPSQAGCNLPAGAATKQPAAQPPVFTFGSKAAAVSPSKKRMHNQLKLRQTASSRASSQPRPNPFAQYGVTSSGSISQAGNASSRSSPGVPKFGIGSPQQSPRRVKVIRPAEMSIDTDTVSQAAASRSNPSSASQPASVANGLNGFHFSQEPAASQCSNPADSTRATSSGRMSSNQPGTSAPLFSTAARQAAAAPCQQHFAGAALAAAADNAAASTPAKFPPDLISEAEDARQTSTGAASTPFKGFGLHADDEDADSTPQMPAASFRGFQPGVQSKADLQASYDYLRSNVLGCFHLQRCDSSASWLMQACLSRLRPGAFRLQDAAANSSFQTSWLCSWSLKSRRTCVPHVCFAWADESLHACSTSVCVTASGVQAAGLPQCLPPRGP